MNLRRPTLFISMTSYEQLQFLHLTRFRRTLIDARFLILLQDIDTPLVAFFR